MAFSHGSLATLLVNSVDYSAFFKDANFDTNIDVAETSALGTTSKTYVPGLEGSKFKLSGMYDPTTYAAFAALKRTTTTFEYRPAGTGSGKPKFSGSCIVTSLTVKTDIKDMANFDAEIQVTGAVTVGTQP